MIATLIDADVKEWEEDCRDMDIFMDHRRSFPRFFKVWDWLTLEASIF